MSAALFALAESMRGLGANLTVEAPGLSPIRIGARPDAARVVFRSPAALAGVERRDHLALAAAFIEGEIEIAGDAQQAMCATELISPAVGWRARLGFASRTLFRASRERRRESIAFHYDRPVEFFLPWFERWRSYSHGLYTADDDDPADAQARKLQYAIDALGLKPGDRVIDLGCGWGSFLEYAGLQGIEVHGITLSREQHRFTQALIRERCLPGSVEWIDFLDYRPAGRFRGAVLMGTLEHLTDYRRVAKFLRRHLEPGARVYADFCSQHGSRQIGAFLASFIWPGSASYVAVERLMRALSREGLQVLELVDDTASYARTVRDWGRALEESSDTLEARFGARDVRTFLLFLWASRYWLEHRKTLAYHLVAGREDSNQTVASRQESAKASPSRE